MVALATLIQFSPFLFSAMILYRTCRCCRRIWNKLLHTILHILAIPCIVIGFIAVLDSHNLRKDKDGNPAPIPNFYSLHSWIGLTAMGLFVLQVKAKQRAHCAHVAIAWTYVRQSQRFYACSSWLVSLASCCCCVANLPQLHSAPIWFHFTLRLVEPRSFWLWLLPVPALRKRPSSPSGTNQRLNSNFSLFPSDFHRKLAKLWLCISLRHGRSEMSQQL